MSDVLVCGSSLPALQAALDFAEVGLQVTVLRDADDGSGGDLSAASASGGKFERDATGAIVRLLERIADPLPGATGAHEAERAAQLRVVNGDRATPKLLSHSGAAEAQPEPNVWGIPESPLSERAIALLGAGRAFRVYMDRVTPLLTIGKTRSLGQLVRRRLGPHALRVLTEPLVRERFGVAADEVEVAIAAPGMNEALTRAGSLTGAALAIAERHRDREATVAPAAGWRALVAALTERLEHYGVAFVDGEITEAHEQAGGVQVTLADGQQLRGRVVVCDVTAGGAAISTAHELLPEFVRVCIESRAQPLIADSGDAANAAVNDAEVLRIAGDWAVTTRPNGALTLRGPRTHRSELDQSGDCDEIVARALREFGDGAGAGPGAERENKAETSDTCEIAAAPFITVDERSQAAERLATWSDRHPAIAPVGRALHGDDLSAALDSAHELAVRLRRELLGIAQD